MQKRGQLLCRLFNEAQSRSAALDKMAFSVMKIGFGHVFGPKGFVDSAFHQILQNIQEPAFPGRSRNDSVVDTFLANGLNLTDRIASESLDTQILTTCLADSEMHELGWQACQPTEGLWNQTVDEYRSKRPGWVARQFTDPNKWLFG